MSADVSKKKLLKTTTVWQTNGNVRTGVTPEKYPTVECKGQGEMIMVAIGERIKESRKQKKLTQQELADQLNVSRSAVSNWEVGRNYPDLDLIVQISDFLEISLDHLLREDIVMVQEVGKEQRRGVVRKRLLQIITPLFIILLWTTGYFLYQDVQVINEFFTPTAQETVVLESNQEEWSAVTFDDEPYLNMESLFWKKTVVNHANNPAELEIRLTDAQTGEVVYELLLKPGREYSLDELSRNTDYLVEIRGMQGNYFLTFL